MNLMGMNDMKSPGYRDSNALRVGCKTVTVNTLQISGPESRKEIKDEQRKQTVHILFDHFGARFG